MLRYALVACFSAFVGYSVGSYQTDHAVCGNYVAKNGDWHGWLSVKDGIYRCFWLESNYPWRVRQGVIDVKGE